MYSGTSRTSHRVHVYMQTGSRPLCCSDWGTGHSPTGGTILAAQGGLRALPPLLVTSLLAGIMMSLAHHSRFLPGHLQAPQVWYSPGA